MTQDKRWNIYGSRFSDLKVQSDLKVDDKVQGQSDLKGDDMVNTNFSMIE